MSRQSRARNIEGHGPTAEVIALVVLARCEMRETKDYDKAIEHLLLARTVPSTDWAQPNISLMLGDCYRANKDPFRAIGSYREAAHAGKVPSGLAAVAHLNLGLVFLYDLQQYHHAEFHLVEAKRLNPALSEAIRSHLAKVPNLTRPVVLAHYMPWFVADAEQGEMGLALVDESLRSEPPVEWTTGDCITSLSIDWPL